MADALLRLAATLLGVVGMGLLALAMDVHVRQVQPDEAVTPARARRRRVLGATALGGSLGCCLAGDHPSIAALVWVMLLTASALTITFTLAWRPRLLSLLARTF